MQVVHDRRGEREQLAREALHLLGDLEAGHAVAHQRLVHVEVEEPHLGVGDLGERLAVDAHELQEGDEREPRRRARRRCSAGAEVVLGDPLQRVRPGSRRRSRRARSARARARSPRAASSSVYVRVGRREQVLHVAVGQPARARRLAQLVERVPALAQARHDAGVGDRRGRPATVAQRDDPVLDPAPQRGRRDVEPRGRPQRASVRGHEPRNLDRESGGTGSWSRRLRAMRPAASAGGVRRVGDALRGPEAPTSRPIAWFSAQGVRPTRPLSTHDVVHRRQTARCGYSASTSVAVAREDRLRDRDQARAAFTSPPDLMRRRASATGDVLLALEVPVGGLGGHRHLHPRLPVDVVGPLPVQVAVLPLRAARMFTTSSTSVNSNRCGTSASRSFGPISSSVAHHREDPVHHRPELLRGGELGAHGSGGAGTGAG